MHLENPKNTTKKILELTNEFGKVQDTKINIQKSVAFLYTNNELLSEREIKEIIPFTIASKRIKYLRINLPKLVKYLYSENCKTLMKKIEDDTNRCKDILCSCIGRINIIKMTILSPAVPVTEGQVLLQPAQPPAARQTQAAATLPEEILWLLEDGGGVRRGDHLPPHKYIYMWNNSCRTPTEHGRRPQISQKTPSGDLHAEARPNP